jgi:uncharacterized membrane protein YfcA
LTDDGLFQITVVPLIGILLLFVPVSRHLFAICAVLLLGVQQSSNVVHRMPAEMSNFVSLWALVFVALLVYAHRLVRRTTKPEPPEHQLTAAANLPVRAWSLGFVLAMLSVGTTIFVVNPLGKYSTSMFNTYANPARSVKMNYY